LWSSFIFNENINAVELQMFLHKNKFHQNLQNTVREY